MRGAENDALRGKSFRASSLGAPYDRILLDNYIKRPMAYLEQGQNFAFNIHKRRELPAQVDVTPNAPAINSYSYKPVVLRDSSVAVIPNAGIYQKSTTVLVEKY